MNRYVYNYRNFTIPYEHIVAIDFDKENFTIEIESRHTCSFKFSTLKEAEKELHRLTNQLTEYYHMKTGSFLERNNTR